MEWPNISVIIPTYNRPEILRQCLNALVDNLSYSGCITYYVGNDGDNITIPMDGPRFFVADRNYLIILDGPRKANKPDQGLGANLNMLLGCTTDDFFLQLDDDHILQEKLDLDRHVKFLLENPEAGWIRLMGIANHDYTADLRGNYWRVRWDSAGNYSLYITSNRPHLKTRRFHDFFGYYPVNKTLGETEEGFCHQCKHVAATWEDAEPHDVIVPQVCIPLNLEPNSESGWAHIGDSWQKQGE